jgi:rhodanese-related sulfurtransferase
MMKNMSVNKVFLMCMFFVFPMCLQAQVKHEKGKGSKHCVEMTPLLFKQAIGSGKVMLIDVRGPEEFAWSRIKGARSASTKEQLLQLVKYLPLQTSIYVYCKKGKDRMFEVAEILHHQGFTNIYCLKGGFDEWGKMKMPVDETEIQ